MVYSKAYLLNDIQVPITLKELLHDKSICEDRMTVRMLLVW